MTGTARNEQAIEQIARALWDHDQTMLWVTPQARCPWADVKGVLREQTIAAARAVCETDAIAEAFASQERCVQRTAHLTAALNEAIELLEGCTMLHGDLRASTHSSTARSTRRH